MFFNSVKVLLVVFFLCLPNLAAAISVTGNDAIDVFGFESDLQGYNNSTVNVHEGSEVAWIDAYDEANVNIYGGDISWLQVHGSSTSSIYGAESISWLILNDEANVAIYGYDFSYSDGHLSGYWENGDAFSFWAVTQDDLNSGDFTSILYSNITLYNTTTPIPEPTSLFLMGTGIAIFSGRKLRKKNPSRTS